MNLHTFHTWIEDPAAMDSGARKTLEELSKEFPYSQVIGNLYLLSLLKENDYRYPRRLRMAAASAADRGRLRQWIYRMEYPEARPENENAPADEQRPAEIAPAGPEEAAAAALAEEKQKMEELETMIRESLNEIEEKKNRLRLLLEEKKSLLAANDLGEYRPDTGGAGALRPLPKDELLEDFLRERRIQPRGAFFDPVEKARQSIEDSGQLTSETLARLLASQGKISRAIKIYQQLLLNYPEKSGYFAAQIENLKKKLKE